MACVDVLAQINTSLLGARGLEHQEYRPHEVGVLNHHPSFSVTVPDEEGKTMPTDVLDQLRESNITVSVHGKTLDFNPDPPEQLKPALILPACPPRPSDPTDSILPSSGRSSHGAGFRQQNPRHPEAPSQHREERQAWHEAAREVGDGSDDQRRDEVDDAP
jgi:hypothetical protein